MPGPTPVDKILDAFTCERVGEDVSQEAKSCDSSENYIWIKTGAVYTAPTLTNDTAWVCLVKCLKTLPNVSKRIIVVTGRHGDAVNWELDDGTPVFTYDESHTVDDNRKERENRLEMSPAQVKVVSVSTMGAPHREKLRSETQTWLKTGHTVIYSWCYSFYTFNSMVCPKLFQDLLAATTQYSRAKNIYGAHMADTTTAWKEISQLRKTSKQTMLDLEKTVNGLGQQVENTRNLERAAKLQHTLAATAESDWSWLPGVLHHPSLSRPKRQPRRLPTHKRFEFE